MPSYAVTGASRGIGYEFIRQLSASPDNVIFGLVRNKGTATALAEFAASAPNKNVHVLQADIVDVHALQAAAEEVGKITGGTLDCLINNGALREDERRDLRLDEYPADLLAQDMQNLIHVNVVGVIYTINAFLPLIRAGNLKKVIAIGSGMGDVDFTLHVGHPTMAPYSISKAALTLAVSKYAVEYKDEGVLFVTISPGLVETAKVQPTPARLKALQYTVAALKKAFPTWDGKQLQPERSVELMLDVISKAGLEVTGRMISQYGNTQWL